MMDVRSSESQDNQDNQNNEDNDEVPDPSGKQISTGSDVNLIQQWWPEITKDQWQDWRWQMSNRLRSLDQLAELLSLSPHQLSKYKELITTYPFAITPYYLSLIDWNDPDDPILKQSIPDLLEIELKLVGMHDPLAEEKDMPVPNLVHRYPDRVLAIVTNTCSMYCRHCTRKRIWKSSEAACSWPELKNMVGYIRNHPVVREVIISGGDPLTMNIDLLNQFLTELRQIRHLEVIRIGTRVPVVLPMRINGPLIEMLKKHRPLWINTQFNHPREITPDAQQACEKLINAGIPVSNQSVLLRGINDDVATMMTLTHHLESILVRPYYLFQCDPTAGVEHFRTNIFKGMEIIENMRGFTGGLCIPTFVVDAPDGGGKIPLAPNYLLSESVDEVILRNYEGKVIRYYNPQENDMPKQSSHVKRTCRVQSGKKIAKKRSVAMTLKAPIR